jgi:CubicO group peptidase (beta-lactamase class C family)
MKFIREGGLASALALIIALTLVSHLPAGQAQGAFRSAGWPTAGWSSCAPEDQGFDSAKLADGLMAIRERGLYLHSLMLIRNGHALLDASFYPYDGKAVHDVASVSKSIMTTLIGIAADRGRLGLDDPALSFFPDGKIANRDAAKERITVRHLAGMSSGLDCTAANDEQTLHEMERAPNFVQFILDRKMIFEPGARFVYCSPGMHLLSAILQRATGMTSLEFARLHLFEPLGIKDVIWPADPQGVNHGWGDIRLHPRDMAKLGLLWLNKGRWEDKQVVSAEWVEASVKRQVRTGRDDDYGYGWWITDPDGSYAAIGRGGQRVQVWPSINAMLVMTGGGVDIDDIEPFFEQAFTGVTEPLPANPAGVARLAAAVDAVRNPPAAKPVPSPPATAAKISGRTYAFETNPLDIEEMGLVFSSPSEAAMTIKLRGGERAESWPIGLDGVYRFSNGPYGLPQGLRGGWIDERTFAAEYDNIANNDHLMMRLTFKEDRLTVESHETAHELGFRFEGRLVKR